MSSIWRKELSKEALTKINNGQYKTLMSNLGMQITEIGSDYLEGTMPIDERTQQIYGLLHGGASAAFAETLGSFAALLVAGDGKIALGVDLSASHLRGVKSGTVTGRATPIRIGQSLQVWEIKIHETGNEEAGLVCHSKITLIVKNSPCPVVVPPNP